MGQRSPVAKAKSDRKNSRFQTCLETQSALIEDIQPSPENDDIYGAIDKTHIDLVNLANDIAANGVREPLCVSLDGFIVSGHRRYAAATLVGIESVLIRVIDIRRDEHDELGWKKVLRAYNHQRVKPANVRMREAMLDVDPDIAHEQLVTQRETMDRDAPPSIIITGTKHRSKISDRKKPFLDASLAVIDGLKAYWPVTVRQVHYGLLNNPPLRNSSTGKQRRHYANDLKSYGDLCDLLTRARLLGLIPWDAIKDETRPVSGIRYSQDAAAFLDMEAYHFLRGYRRDLLQSQCDHIELIVEKLTVQSIIETIAKKFCLPMTVGRGYCSIDPRYDIVQRYRKSGKDRLKLLICSDFDPDGEEIAESFARSIRDDFGVDGVEASKILLRQDQCKKWGIPHNGLEAKTTSTNYKKFMHRYDDDADVFELEAVPPQLMQSTVQEAIEGTLDLEAFNRELEQEKQDAALLQGVKASLQDSFANMSGNGLGR
jgi:hypothetical protein